MRNIPAALQTHLEGEVTSVSRCLKIIKTNGDVLRVTEHDLDIIVSAETYFAAVPVTTSAIQSTDTLAVDNAEVTLGYTDDLVLKSDFEDGLYDEAQFELFIVNWEDPTDGIAYLKRGTLGAITFLDETAVKIQLRGLTQNLQKPVVEKYSPTCRVNLGGLKCGVVNVPTRIRRNRQKCKTFDWFLVPTLNITEPVVTNMSFETNLTGWTGSGWVRDNDFTAGAGSFYVRGDTIGGIVADSSVELTLYRDFATLADLGMANADVDDGLFTFDLEALLALDDEDNPNPGQLFIEQFNSDGHTLKRSSSGWKVGDFEEWQGIGVAEFVLPGTRTIRIGLQNRVDHGTVGHAAFDDIFVRYWLNQADTWGGAVFRTVRVPAFDQSEDFSPANPSFEIAAPQANANTGVAPSWTQTASDYFRTVATATGFVPLDGGFMLQGGDNGSTNPDQIYKVTQVLTIADFADHTPDAANITAGFYAFALYVNTGKIDAASDPRITVEFLTAANGLIGSAIDTGYDTASSIATWIEWELSGTVPDTCAKVRISLYARSGASSAANVVFDAVSAFLFVTAYENPADPSYGKLRESEPAYDYNLNAMGFDGEVIVQARPTVFYYGEVTDTVDERTFEDTSINQTAALMYSGKIVWLSGANAGKTSFARIWDNSTKLLKMYNQLNGTIAIGDKYVYAIGCDKTIGRCADTFGNATNFRGEPYLPGPERVIEFMTAS